MKRARGNKAKGILGIQKDPKNAMLFSFNVREGEEWPSSDSDDSDYNPGDNQDTVVNAKKKKMTGPKGKNDVGRKTQSRPSSKRSSKSSCVEDKNIDSQKIPCAALPPEVWLRIFQYAVELHGSLPLLCRLARVCKMWNDLTKEPQLWQHIDLSHGWIKSTEKTLRWLMDNRLSQQTVDINLQSWKNLTGAALTNLAEVCKTLRKINLAYCSKIDSASINVLAKKCEQLESINLSFTNVPVPAISQFLDTRCDTLKEVLLGGYLFTAVPQLLRSLKACTHLEVLEISNVRFSTDVANLDVEEVQECWPKLRVLRLCNSKFRYHPVRINLEQQSPGFPCLEELSLAVHSGRGVQDIGVNDFFYSRILKNSPKLRLLDFRGLIQITLLRLSDLDLPSLECLYISQTSSSAGFPEVLRKWYRTLKVLDISWNTYPDCDINQGFSVYKSTDEDKKLTWLNLAGTSVTLETVKDILEHVNNLEYINLSSCRSMPRGVKREFSGRKEIKELHKELIALQEEET